MKRSFCAVSELQRRFPQRFVPKLIPLPGISLQLFTFALAVTFGFAMLLSSPDTYALAAIGTEITTMQGDVVTVLTTLLTAVLTIGVASAAVFIAGSVMKWLRIIA